MTAPSPDRRAIITEALRKIDDLTARLEVAENAGTEPIAVVGMGCRFPGGVHSPDDYWKLLCDGRSGVVRVPADRWDADAYYNADHTVPGTICNTQGGFLTSWQPDEFDAEFFAIPPREAAAMDPQQRLLLEVAWEALENAGIAPHTLRGTQTSVFVGLTTNDYSLTFAGKLPPESLDPYIPFGNAANFAAGRLSYFLGVNGPAVVIDTACSSSLVSIHLACQSLRRKESDYALAAGVNLLLSPENSIACSRWGMLAPDGNCKTFDADADGYVRSEGCGVVVLKRLADAVADGDPVLALVRGSATNQDGASSGQTVPNGPAQQALMRRALASARLQPSDVDYVEAHGTGTALGDPIELDALANVFADRDVSAPLVVGSVKTNLGHLESAAGVAGFIKAVLSVSHGHIPKQLHFSALTPKAGPNASRLVVASEPMDWPSVQRPRRAAVSSFGVSGTNAHVVIEQAPEYDAVKRESDPPVTTLVVSGKTDERIAATAATLADWLETAGTAVSLAGAAHTLNHHRARYRKFVTVTASDREQAVAGLRAVAGGYPATGVVGSHEGPCTPGTVFVYSGQGSQWAGMGRRLIAEEKAFSEAVTQLDPIFVAQTGFSLEDVLRSGAALVGIDRIQPALVGVQLALTSMWRSRGVEPDAVIGHSMGEVTAAVVAGALTVADGLRVIATRSRLMSRLSGQGAMALLELDAEAAHDLCRSYPGVTVAVYASPRQTVIAGTPDQVDAIVAAVDAQDRLARRIDVDVASHHSIIDPVLPELRTLLADLQPRTPTIPIYSTVEAGAPGGAPRFDADYWAANLRNPVRFSQAVAAAGDRHGTFVEVSPHPVLLYAIDDTLADTHHHSVGTLARDAHDTLVFHTNLNAAQADRMPEIAHAAEPHPALPNTPWLHTRHWIALPEAPEPREGASPPAVDSWFYDLTWTVKPPPATGRQPRPNCLVVADDVAAAGFARMLSEVPIVSAAAADWDGPALRQRLTAADHVIYAPSPRGEVFDAPAAHTVTTTLRRLVRSLVGTDEAPKLTVLTRNAQPMAVGDRANPAHAALWGMGRTLAVENPEIWRGVLDVDDMVPPELVAHHVRAELFADDAEDQVVYRAGARHVPRLVRRNAPMGITGLPRGTSHLVIGATGNIGPYLIRQLADMGADTIVAVSRRGGAELHELTAELAGRGVTLVDVAADTADEAAMTALLARFGDDLPPLDGIYLAALSGGAGLIADMPDADVASMFRPKVDAVSLLHRLTLTTPVPRFVMFSSITGILGSRWLGHYTAAGAYLDTFAYARRALGLSATVVDWGLWKSWADAQPATAAAGLTPMPNDEAIRMLPAILSPDAGVHPIVVAADWERIAEAYRMRAALHVVDDLLGEQDADTDPGFGTLLGALDERGLTWTARLQPHAKPYPGGHRVQGVEVVPASVLVQTLSVAAKAVGAAGLGDVQFEYPVVVDGPRTVRVTVDDASITMSSTAGGGTVTHVGARLLRADECADAADGAPATASGVDNAAAIRDFDAASVAELQRAWGVEGQPFPWTITSCQSTTGGVSADVDLPDASPVALLDAAVHVSRLAGFADPRLMFPSAVGLVLVGEGGAQRSGPGTASIEIRRRPGGADELVVDIVGNFGAGGPRLDVRGLRYTAVESGHTVVGPTQADTPPTQQPVWSNLTPTEIHGELQDRLQAILAAELGMPQAAVGLERPFPELGLDSMMAMNVLRKAKDLVGIDLSATMLWNHPTIESMAGFLADLLVPEPGSTDPAPSTDVSDSVLDALFAHVEASAGNESGL